MLICTAFFQQNYDCTLHKPILAQSCQDMEKILLNALCSFILPPCSVSHLALISIGCSWNMCRPVEK